MMMMKAEKPIKKQHALKQAMKNGGDDAVKCCEAALRRAGFITGGERSPAPSPLAKAQEPKEMNAMKMEDTTEGLAEPVGEYSAEYEPNEVGDVSPDTGGSKYGVSNFQVAGIVWDKNITTFGMVPADLMKCGLNASDQSLFTDANLNCVVRRGSRAMSQQKLSKYIECQTGFTPDQPIETKYRSKSAYVKLIKDTTQQRGNPTWKLRLKVPSDFENTMYTIGEIKGHRLDLTHNLTNETRKLAVNPNGN